MAETPGAAHDTPFPMQGTVFISTVYPVIEVDRDLVEWVKPIADAYSFWGKTLISAVAANRKTFFPAPLSYPYKFSEKGVHKLRQQLKEIPVIDSATIAEREFPNIPRDLQGLYSADEQNKILIRERYVSFKFKDWPSVEVMKFPTFVVLAFDHTRKPVNSLRDYRRLADHWKEKVQAFHKNDGLKHVLGIAHKEGEWRNVPSLTFVAFSTIFDEPDFWNFYLWNWKNGPEDVKLPFLRDIRIQGFSGSTYPSELVLDQCHNIIYEYNLNLPITRYYYSSIPLFDLDNNWSIHDQFPLHGTGGILTRILRTALFVNVTLPSMVDLSKVLKDSLGDNFYKIQKMRMEIFNDFTQSKLDSSHAEVRLHADWHQGVIREIDRIDEIQKGFSKLLEDIQQPFTPPISHPSSRKTQDTSSKGENHCLDLFHFHKTYNTVNDSNKAFEYIRDITDNRNSIEINQRRFENEVSNTSTLLESRRALLQDRRNTLVAIIVPAFGAFIFGLGLLFLGQYLWPWR